MSKQKRKISTTVTLKKIHLKILFVYDTKPRDYHGKNLARKKRAKPLCSGKLLYILEKNERIEW